MTGTSETEMYGGAAGTGMDGGGAGDADGGAADSGADAGGGAESDGGGPTSATPARTRDRPARFTEDPPQLVTGADGLARPVWASRHDDLREYYDTEWGMPITDERGVFERLSLEAFQCGLSWATILRRREAFRSAFDGFDPERVAAFTEDDVERLLPDPGIIRHRGKITATISNARATLALRDEEGLGARGDLGPDATLADLIWSYRPETTLIPETMAEIPAKSDGSAALSKELKKRGFRFVGPTTMFALMEALGIVDTHLVGSHRRGTSGLWNADGTRAA